MPPHPLTNFEMQKYYQNNPKFMVFIQEIIYLKKRMGHMQQELIGTNCIALYVNSNNIIYFDRFGVEHIPKEI